MKKKEKHNLELNGIPFKSIIHKNEKGEIVSLMEKPKLKEIDPKIHVSGCHIFTDKPHENHYDHYHDGKEWKERPKEGKKLKFRTEVDKEKVLI